MVKRVDLGQPRERLDDRPLPAVVEVGPHWSPFMVELAGIIGARDALVLIERLGGHNLNIPAIMPDDWAPVALIGLRKARLFHDNYAGWNNAHTRRIGTKVSMPTARAELKEARLGPILEGLRAGNLSLSDAVDLTGMSAKHLSTLRNRPQRGAGAVAYVKPGRLADARQITIFDVIEEEQAA